MTIKQVVRKVDGWGGRGNHDDIVEERTIQQNTAIIAQLFYSTRGLRKNTDILRFLMKEKLSADGSEITKTS